MAGHVAYVIAVSVFLTRVGDGRRVVAGVAYLVAIDVALVSAGDARTVIGRVAHAVSVAVFDRDQRESVRHADVEGDTRREVKNWQAT